MQSETQQLTDGITM